MRATNVAPLQATLSKLLKVRPSPEAVASPTRRGRHFDAEAEVELGPSRHFDIEGRAEAVGPAGSPRHSGIEGPNPDEPHATGGRRAAGLGTRQRTLSLRRSTQTGRRCNSRHLLQIDHILPFALGGAAEPGNLRLPYFAHYRSRHQRRGCPHEPSAPEHPTPSPPIR